MASVSDFRERYRRSLEAYIAGSAEGAELVDPMGLGRAALDAGCGLVELLSIHQSALPAVIAELSGATARNQIGAIAKAEEFLTQIAAPYEMTHLGWREAVDQMRRLNESLERQVAERTAALRDNEAQLRRERDAAQRYLDVADVMILVLDVNARVKLINQRGCRMLGYDGPEDMLDKSWIEFFIPERLRESMQDVFVELFSGQPASVEHYINPIVTRTGEERLIAWHNSVLRDENGGTFASVSSGDDITERKNIEDNLKRSEDRFRSIFSAVCEGIFLVSPTGTFTEVNDVGCAMFGYQYDELIGGDIEMLSSGVPPYTQRDGVAWTEKAMASGRPQSFDWHCKAKDGRLFWADISIRFASISGENVVLATVRDITERKEAERRVHESEEQLKRAQRLARMGSDLRNLRTGERGWSDETYRIFGVDAETFVPTIENVFKLIHPEDQTIAGARRDQIAAGICPEPSEYRIVRPDGEVRHVYRDWELIHDDAGLPVQLLGTIQDITERRRTEAQLRQAQKMEAIGNLTGGMAHDFNNLLGVIIGNLELARTRMGTDQELHEIVGEALEAAWRGADLNRRLLAFARRQPLRPARIDINELVSDTLRLLRRLLGEDIEVSLNLAENIWPVSADPAQLEAALANLANNARDAMPRGGRLIITTANRRLDAEYAATHADVTAGDYAMIEVSDTGAGMSAEIISQIFEPFFTTKEPGKGTGLGLSMVFGFLRQSGGHVNVYSEPGVGTTFRLYLPRETAGSAVRELMQTVVAVEGAGETILVVEDNDAMRRVVVRQLRTLGYHVLECDRAAAALEVLQHEPVDLLFTDVVMPGGLDGTELARLVRERWLSLKIMLTSGFPEARLNASAQLLDNVQLLSKPYSNDELAAALRTALNG